MQERCVRAVVNGRVQGVGFRAWTQRQAQSRGLSGWVRNRRDGSVEAVFEGPEEAIAAMLEALQIGPVGGQVERVAVAELDNSEMRPSSGRFDILTSN